VQALSFSDAGEVTGEVVFAGYGLVVPNSQDFGYDSYQGLDVKDKIVVALRYFPEDADQKTRAILAGGAICGAISIRRPCGPPLGAILATRKATFFSAPRANPDLRLPSASFGEEDRSVGRD